MAPRKSYLDRGRPPHPKGEGNNDDANASQASALRSPITVVPRLARPGRSPPPDVYAEYTLDRRRARRPKWRERGVWMESDSDGEGSLEEGEVREGGNKAPGEAGNGAAEDDGPNNDGRDGEKQDGEQQAPGGGNDGGENDDGERAPDGDGERGLRWEAEEAAMRARASQRVEAWLSDIDDATPLLRPSAPPSPHAVTDNGVDSDDDDDDDDDEDAEGGVPININTLREAASVPNSNVLMPRRGGPARINARREAAPAPTRNVLMPRGGYSHLPPAEGTRYRTRSVTRAAAAARQAAAAQLVPGQGFVAIPIAEQHAAQLTFMCDDDDDEDKDQDEV